MWIYHGVSIMVGSFFGYLAVVSIYALLVYGFIDAYHVDASIPLVLSILCAFIVGIVFMCNGIAKALRDIDHEKKEMKEDG